MPQALSGLMRDLACAGLFAVILLLAACSSPAPAPAEPRAVDEYRQLANVMQDLQFAYEAGDVDDFASHVSDDFAFADGGKSELLEGIRESLSQGEMISFEDVRISIDGARAQVEDFTVSTGEDVIRMTLRFEKRQGVWLLTSVDPPEENSSDTSQIVVDTATPDTPPADNWMSPIVTRSTNPSSGELPDVEDPAAMNQPITEPQY